MQIAIITGASSGLGKVFFEKIVERYPQLDEYWVIARSENKLKELAEQHPQQKVRVCRWICLTDAAWKRSRNCWTSRSPTYGC